MEITATDAENLLKLIARVNITGKEATPVAILQQKLVALSQTPPSESDPEDLKQPTESPEEVVKELEDKK